MAFSSNFFIFAYLPIVLLAYFASPADQEGHAAGRELGLLPRVL